MKTRRTEKKEREKINKKKSPARLVQTTTILPTCGKSSRPSSSFRRWSCTSQLCSGSGGVHGLGFRFELDPRLVSPLPIPHPCRTGRVVVGGTKEEEADTSRGKVAEDDHDDDNGCGCDAGTAISS